MSREVKKMKERKLGEFEEGYVLKAAKEAYEKGLADIRINPKKSALIVVDMIEEFTKPKWTPYWVPEATRILHKVKRLIDACREVGVTVIYTYYNFHSKGLDSNPVIGLTPIGKASNEFAGQIFNRETIDSMIKPRYGEDVSIQKWGYGAFTHTQLDYVLKNLEVDTVIICGTMTNYCCGLTAREAFMHGYKVVFGSDVNATDDSELQEAELKTLRRGYALVITSDEIIEALHGRGYYAANSNP